VAELEANIAAAGKPEAALRWFGRALDPARSWNGFPSIHVPAPEVKVQGQPLSLAHVLQGLREAA
jgi:hypothetical protein